MVAGKVCFLLCLFVAAEGGETPAGGEAATLARTGVCRPVIEGPWRRIAGNPDLGAYTSEKQQPVDFGVWQAADGTWQLWSCIRHTQCGGHTRLFYRWEGAKLTDSDWRPMGIAMEADPSVGEQPGGLQAPHVLLIDGVYHMFYGDWERICLATSADGKAFTRVRNERGEPGLFSGPWENTRDAMVLPYGGRFYCYYTGHLNGPKQVGADFCRVSTDLKDWSLPPIVAYGGSAGDYRWSAECPHVVHRPQEGRFYLFRTQRYGRNNISHVYASRDPLDFGINDDRWLVGTLPVAAPEIILHEGQYYIAALTPELDGIQLARLAWEPVGDNEGR